MQLYINRLLGSNKVIQMLTLSDFGMNSSGAISGVIFTLFVINQIQGATITDAGLSSLFFLSSSALLNIPLGRFMDKTKGFMDENIILASSLFLRGIAMILLAFSTQIWQLYILQVILGIARSMNFTSWRVLFSKFLDTKHIAAQWSLYDTVIAIGLGVATLIGGILGDIVPFSYVIFIAGIISIVGGIFPLLMINDIKGKH